MERQKTISFINALQTKPANNHNKDQISMGKGYLARERGGEGKSKHFNQIQYFVIDFSLPDIPCRILIMLLTLRYLAKAIGFVKVKAQLLA